jgi:hypothetical protein
MNSNPKGRATFSVSKHGDEARTSSGAAELQYSADCEALTTSTSSNVNTNGASKSLQLLEVSLSRSLTAIILATMHILPSNHTSRA